MPDALAALRRDPHGYGHVSFTFELLLAPPWTASTQAAICAYEPEGVTSWIALASSTIGSTLRLRATYREIGLDAQMPVRVARLLAA